VKAVFVPDTHFPYVNKRQLDRIFDFTDKFQPDIVVQLGDLYDLYCFGRWPRNISFVTPEEELREARVGAETFWAAMRHIVPNARKHQILGNHDDRISKLVRTKAPELEAVLDMLDFHSLWRFEGVTTTKDGAEELVLEGLDQGRDVIVMHGHRGKLGDHVNYNMTSTVCGHSHRGGVVYRRYRDASLWELNAGYIADQSSVPLGYGAQKISNGVAGFGVVDEDGARFIPL
jgi:predicted phosphodiesterase